MQCRAFPTELGDIWLWSDEAALDSKRPLVLAITGSFAISDPPAMRLPLVINNADVAVGFLPGNHCPTLAVTSVEAYAAAYSEVLNTYFTNRPIFLWGESVGALVCMAINCPATVRSYLLEPPLLTGKLHNLLKIFRIEHPLPKEIEFIEAVFGYMENGVVERDYRYLLNRIKVPTRVFLGDDPETNTWNKPGLPSLVYAPERELMANHPLISTTNVTGAGHNTIKVAGDDMAMRLRNLIKELVQ